MTGANVPVGFAPHLQPHYNGQSGCKSLIWLLLLVFLIYICLFFVICNMYEK